MSFYKLSSITAFIAVLLSATLIGIPELLFYVFNIEANGATYFMSRRAGILFIGLAFVSWQIRNIFEINTQQAICLGFMAIMFGLAALGCIEFVLGNTEMGVFLAILTELTLGWFYLKIWRENNLTTNAV